MDKPESPAYLFNTHAEAEDAIRSLDRSGFDVKKLSIVGKGFHSEEHPVGFYTLGDKVRAWGGVGAFWGGIWGLLLAPAVFFIPGFGLLALAGPVVSVLVGALEGAVVVGGLSAIGAALTQIGVHKEHVIRYETALKADKFLVVVHGNADDLNKARTVLTASKALTPA
jgi:hypothetical protein